uniref:Uncharacterized protein n=1 Tax=Arundo donax TaxID=35708 RepID=A0A0A9A6A4_ARUDO
MHRVLLAEIVTMGGRCRRQDNSFTKENAEALRKWSIKASKAMFMLNTMIEEDLVEHIRDAETPKGLGDIGKAALKEKNQA